MVNFKKFMTVALATTIILSATGCNMIEKTEDAINRSTVAKVNGEKITRGELDSTLGPIFSQLEEEYGENYKDNSEAKELMFAHRKNELESVIIQEIIDQKAKELGINLSEEELLESEEDYIKKSKEEFDTEEEFNKALEESKLTEEDLRREGRELAVREALSEKINESVNITDEAVKQHYDSNQEKYTEEPNEYKVSHILVKTKEEAEEVKKRLDAGEEFSTVAKEVSQDEKSKEKGGDLGYLPYNSTELSLGVFTAAKTLDIGKVSEPIEDSTGFHIVKLEDKKEHPVKKFEDVKDDIKKSLEESEKFAKWQTTLVGWIQESEIKRYEDNLK